MTSISIKLWATPHPTLAGKEVMQEKYMFSFAFLSFFCVQTHTTHVLPPCEVAATAPGVGILGKVRCPCLSAVWSLLGETDFKPLTIRLFRDRCWNTNHYTYTWLLNSNLYKVLRKKYRVWCKYVAGNTGTMQSGGCVWFSWGNGPRMRYEKGTGLARWRDRSRG